MWNPDALNGWEADDDLLSWRSFDTAVDAEAKTALVDGRVPANVFNEDEAALEPASCTAKSEQDRQWTNAAEVFPVRTKVPVLKQFRLDTKCTIGKSPHHASERKVLEWEGQSDAIWTRKSRKVVNRFQLQRHEGYNEPQELPSTSEMVRIEEQGNLERNPILEWPQVTGHDAGGLELQLNRAPASSSNGTLHIHPIQQEPLASDVYSRSSSVFPMDGLAPEWLTDEPSRIQYQDKASPETQVYQTRLPEKDAPISLSDFLTRKQDAEGHREELEAQQRHFMRLATELDESEDKVLALLAEEKTWKEKVTHLENQLEHLQIVVVENANKADQDAQVHVQQSSELAQLRAKCQALQDANEDLQDQAKRAITERDRVQKDYSQVVYELGKTQKQLNTISQEKTSVAEKAFLVREIEQLQTDNEQLREKLKAAEASKPSSVLLSQDRQPTLQLQMHIQELEDEVRRLRYSSAAQLQQQPPPPLTVLPQTPTVATACESPPHQDTAHSSEFPMSPNMNGYTDSSTGGTMPSRPVTLKDIMAAKSSHQRRQQFENTSPGYVEAPSARQFPPTSSTTRLSSPQGTQHFETQSSSVGGGWARRSAGPSQSSIGSLIQHTAASGNWRGYDSGSTYHSAADTSLNAPFATEKQSFLTDAVHRRLLEQELMNLHVEREQTEARLIKVEQSGLKTMSSRTERERLDGRLQALRLDISRLKSNLR